MYERDVARNGALVRGQTFGSHDADALVKMAKSGNAAQDVRGKPTEPTQPLLFDALSRLQIVHSNLIDANGRLSAVADRIIGSEQNTNSSSGSTATVGPSCAADELLGLIQAIARQVDELHGVASRVERIG